MLASASVPHSMGTWCEPVASDRGETVYYKSYPHIYLSVEVLAGFVWYTQESEMFYLRWKY